MAWWGIYLVVMIYRTQGEFEIEIPMSRTIEALRKSNLSRTLGVLWAHILPRL